MTDYKLNIITNPEITNSLDIPKELIDLETKEKFGEPIRLIWRLCKLKNENAWEKIQEDESNGITYSEINIKNLTNLTESIDCDFLTTLLNKEVLFDLDAVGSNTKYNISFSIESDKNVEGARGMKWSDVNIISFERKNKKWVYSDEDFWNHKKWSIIKSTKGYCEIKTPPRRSL
jgi:hypothetical protein